MDMPFRFTPFTIPLLFIAATTASAGVYAWRNRHAPGAKSLSILAAVIAGWVTTYAIGISTFDLSLKILVVKVEYLWMVVIPLAWFSFAVEFTGREAWLTPRNLAMLAAVPILTVIVAWTNDFHNLLWNITGLDTDRSYAVLTLTYGPYFWIYVTLAYALFLFGTLLLCQVALASARLHRNQALALIAGGLAPWVGNIIYVAGLSPWYRLDLTTLGFGVAVVALSWAFFRYKLLNIVPIAYSAVVSGMSDGLIVLDKEGRVIDANPVAQKILGRTLMGLIGRPFQALEAREMASVNRSETLVDGDRELETKWDGETRVFRQHSSWIHGRKGQIEGRLLMFHDVTDRRNAEAAAKRALESAQRTEELRSLNQLIVETEETERFRVANELHDGPFQKAIFLVSQLGIGNNQSVGIGREIVSELREIMARLRPAMLEDLGVIPALDWLLADASERWGVTARLLHDDIEEERRFPAAIELAVFRIVQEAVSNSIEHGKCARLDVRLCAKTGELVVKVSDNGVGMSQTRPPRAGFGLSSMRERALQFGGSIDIRSAPGAGTTVRARIPLN